MKKEIEGYLDARQKLKVMEPEADARKFDQKVNTYRRYRNYFKWLLGR